MSLIRVPDLSNIVEVMQPFIGKSVTGVPGEKEPEGVLRTVRFYSAGVFEISCDMCRGGRITRLVAVASLWWEQLRFDTLSIDEILSGVTRTHTTPERRFIDAMFRCEPDVHLVAADGKKVPALKAVLGASSPVFHAMFTTNMREKDAKEIDLKDNTHGALEAFVQLLYAKPCPTLKMHILEIIELADVYQIGSLTEFVDKTGLKSIFTKENSAVILFKAAQRKQTGIWKMALSAVGDKDVDLESSEQWKQMKRTGSAMEMDADGLSEVVKAIKKSKK